jgi:hypothetical protein
MPVEVSPAALASTALSVALATIELLVRKKLITKEDALEIYDTLIRAKDAKSDIYANDTEAEAANLLAGLRQRLAERLPDEAKK